MQRAYSIEKHPSQTADDILDAALLVFSERGFAGSTTREISSRAGVNHPLIAYYFGNKEKLWRAAVTHLFDRLDTYIAEDPAPAAKENDSLGAAKRYLSRYIDYCAEHPEHARLMMQESTSNNPRLSWAVKSHIKERFKIASPIIENLISDHFLPDVSPIATHYIITAACQQVYALAAEAKLLTGVTVTNKKFIEQHKQAVLAILFRA